MSQQQPLVSIGMPLYNGEASVTHALDKLISQDYSNIEIIISDNASTDRTWEICQEYAAREPRIKLYRNETNLGPAENFQRVFRLATGKYFLWAAHDDDRTTDYIRRCVEQLEANPGSVLCYTDQRFIESKTHKEMLLRYTLKANDPVFWRRVHQMLTYKPTPYSLIYGVYLREAVIPYIPMPKSPIVDLHFILQVCQEGPFVHVPEVLFTKGVQLKEFHSRMSAISPRYGRMPAFMVYTVMFGSLLRFAWTAGKDIRTKFHLMMSAAHYALPRMITHLIPVGVRGRLREAAKNNRILKSVLHPFLSTKQVVE